MSVNQTILEELQKSIVLRSENGMHVYRHNGVDYFGVSSFLDVIAQDWKTNYYKKNTAKAIDRRLAETADIGKRLHTLIEADCRGHEVSPEPDCLPAFEQWKQFKAEHRIELIANEAMVIHPLLGCGGTVDLLCMYEGRPMVADFKTGYVGITYGYQLAAYRQMLLHWKIIDPSFGMAVFQIHRDGHVAQPFIYEHYDFCFQRFLDAMGMFKGTKFQLLRWWYAPDELLSFRAALRGDEKREWEADNHKKPYEWEHLTKETRCIDSLRS